MAKASMINRDLKRVDCYNKNKTKRSKLKAQLMSKDITIEERFNLQLELNKLPRNSSKSRQRNRCQITGRPRGYYRKFNMSRIALRHYASFGQIPGLVKSSW